MCSTRKPENVVLVECHFLFVRSLWEPDFQVLHAVLYWNQIFSVKLYVTTAT